MDMKFYAMYSSNVILVFDSEEYSSKVILVFDSEEERDTYVYHEQIVHPEIKAVDYEEIKGIIHGRKPRYDSGFGCMAILS